MALKNIQNDPAPIPKSFSKKYKVEIETFEGRALWTLAPKTNPSNEAILYLHGGAYVFNMYPNHWTFLAKVMDKTQATILIANYPLAPQESVQDTFAYMEKLYPKFQKTYAGKKQFLMGDSAGGGLALAFAQQIRDKALELPAQIILLSPWLDISMANPDIAPVEEADKLLRVEGLRKAGELYAGKMDTQAPRVSPIYGEFQGLPPIAIFIGSHDLFIADCRKLREILENKKVDFHYYEYPKMLHVWMILPVKEAKTVLNQLRDLIKK